MPVTAVRAKVFLGEPHQMCIHRYMLSCLVPHILCSCWTPPAPAPLLPLTPPWYSPVGS